MNVEKKLDSFLRAAMRQVETQKEQITNELDEAFSGSVEEAVSAAEKQAQERIRNEKYKIDKTKNKEIIAESSAAKRKLMALRNQLTDELFEDVAAEVYAFTASVRYDTYLVEEIEKVYRCNPAQYAYVQVMERDTRLAGRINETTRLTVEEVSEDFIGGFRLISANRKVIDDHTLLSRLKEERKHFSIRGNAGPETSDVENAG